MFTALNNLQKGSFIFRPKRNLVVCYPLIIVCQICHVPESDSESGLEIELRNRDKKRKYEEDSDAESTASDYVSITSQSFQKNYHPI